MEDGPEEAEGHYEYGGKTYRLIEDVSWTWKVFDGDAYLGIVTQSGPNAGDGFEYTAKCAGEENEDAPTTDDWRAAVNYLIDTASL
jgi:hypothetical protein